MKKIFTTIRFSQEPGFTLLEMLFAVIIFSFALVSLMTIAGRGVIASASAKDQLTAEFLAEESIEVARNMRDKNYLDVTDWLAGISQCTSDNPCDVDYTGGTPVLVQCSEGCRGNLLFNNQGDFKPDSGNGGIPTTFWRELVIEPIHDDVFGNPDQVRVDATVHWKQKSLERKMTVTAYMSNWQF